MATRYGILVRAGVVGAVVMLLLAGFAAGEEEPQPPLSFVTAGDSPPELTLKPVGDGLRASLRVTVANPSSYRGRLVFVFVRAADGGRTRATSNPDTPSKGVRLFARRAEQFAIGPQRVASFPLSLRTRSDRKQALTGTLVARPASGRTPAAALPVTATPEDAASPWAKARVQPESPTMVVSRCVPRFVAWIVGNCELMEEGEDVEISGAAAQAGGENPIATGRLSADNGGRLDIALNASDESATGGTIKAELEASGITKSGTYAGALPLDPTAEDAPKLSVKVKAQDFILWPALAVLLGAWLGWWFTRWRNEQRPKKLIEGTIKQADLDYRTARKNMKGRCPYYLDEVFGETADWTCPPAPDAPEAAILLCEVTGVRDKEALATVTEKVNDLWARVKTWEATCAEAEKLRDALRDLEKLEEKAALAGATKELLAERPAPQDADSAAAYLRKLGEQRLAIELWMSAWELAGTVRELHEGLSEIPAGLSERDRSKIQDHNPDALVAAYLLPARTLQDLQAARLIERLRESLWVLNAIALAHPTPKTSSVDVLEQLEKAAMRAAASFEFAAPESPQALVANIRARDRWDFWVPAVITTLVFLGSIYADQTFGSVWQYLTAFAAGITGQLLVNWQLLPWFRSYRLVPDAAPTK